MRKIFAPFFVLSIILIVTGCASRTKSVNADENTKTIAVSVVKAQAKTVEASGTLNGKVKPFQEIDIVSKLPGKVAAVNFDIGGKVKEGDVLFTLDDSDIKLQLNQTEAALNMAQSGLNRTKGGALEQQISQLKTALVSAETTYNDAKLALERTRQLFETGAMSQQALEAAETRFKVAKEQFDSASTSLKLTETKINPESIASAEAQVKQAKASYDIAMSQLENTIVKSPINGVVAVKNINAGEMTGNGVPAMTVIDLSSVTVDLSVPETIINKIHIGDKVKVTIQSAFKDPLEGEVAAISPAADAKTQNFPVKIKIANDKGILKGGMFAEVRLNIEKADNVTAVPLQSIIEDQGKKYVYIINEGKAAKREIRTGFSNEEWVQVTEGVKDNEEVVTKGQNLLSDGVNVTVVER